MATKNVNASQFASWLIGSGWEETSSEGAVWVWSRTGQGSTGYRVGRIAIPSLALSGAPLTSASIHVKTGNFYNYSPYTFRIAVSSNASAFTTDITSGYITTTSASYAENTEYSFPITSLLGSIDLSATFYIFIIISLPDASDITFKYLSDYQAYLEVGYTPLDNADTVGRYNGSTFENCEVYRYNGSTWEQCDVFRYDGTQFVECSTT